MSTQSVKMDSFYVHLQSDASALHYSDNKLTNFRNHLAIPIKTDSNRYEVALSEISYTYTSPYIKKGTVLYTLNQASTPRPEYVKYPDYSTITGENLSNTAETYDTDMVEESRKQHQHLEYLSQLWNTELFPTTTRKVTLRKVTIDIVARKELKTTEALLHELSEQLQPLKITFTWSVGKKGKKMLTIKQKEPEYIGNILLPFSDKIKKHFQFGKGDAYSYVTEGHDYDCYPLTTPILIANGENY